MSIGQGTITLDPDSNMIKLGALTMHRDSGTGDAILMNTDGAYNPFRASKFLIDATEVIDNNRNFTGVTATFSGNVSVGGTLTYEDVTNIDSVGLITARSGVKVPDDQQITVGTGNDGRMYYNSSNDIFHFTITVLMVEPLYKITVPLVELRCNQFLMKMLFSVLQMVKLDFIIMVLKSLEPQRLVLM